MRYYLDTSLLVSSLCGEVASKRAQAWLDKRAADELLISAWVVAEFSSALSIKLRTGEITRDGREKITSLFARSCRETFIEVAIGREHFQTAATFAEKHELGLRAGDALHLAIAGAEGATLVTLDRKLAAAGVALGVRTISV